MIELELKAVVPDPDQVRERLQEANARPGFNGFMEDRRFDRAGELVAKDHVLRIRHYRAGVGVGAGGGGGGGGADAARTRVSWKGPARVVDGYKERDEIELEVSSGDRAEALFQALGYELTESIDRRVEYYTMPGTAVVRLEWYPRMDVLVEVEGAPLAIEGAIGLLGIDRSRFTAESLIAFVLRYEARTGRPAAISLAALGPDRASWDSP